MQDLLYSNTDNPGSLVSVQVCPTFGFASFPAAADGQVSAAVSFRQGYRWFTIYSTANTPGFEEPEDETDNGPVWMPKISLFLPSDNAAYRRELFRWANYRFVAQIYDQAGIYRRVGTIIEPLSLKSAFNTGSAVPDRRGYSITLSGSTTTPAPVII
ncbi:hypothetical protein [Arsenicibacter rosenii]|uniref:Uncharacterized protein n=1 Tax=Arsenicibacter rosenii TaxID=1750698 RepID=A0A1S2VDK6_9BACT|nr:hypothetical protein [Arsenicibacter rosenii]OIN56793.1 hypothetical protein BLX24_22725 [Arsenicibacter rosenii]